MLLKGMNDPLLKAYQHPKSRLMISRFRGLAGDRRLSDWQVFCILVNGFTNYWYVLSVISTSMLNIPKRGSSISCRIFCIFLSRSMAY